MSQWVKPLPHKYEILNSESQNPYEARKGHMFYNSIASTVRSETSKEACGPVGLVYITAITESNVLNKVDAEGQHPRMCSPLRVCFEHVCSYT